MKQFSISLLFAALMLPITSSTMDEQGHRQLWGSKGSTARFNQLEKYWIDAQGILDSLDDYSAIWIKPHGCVWSECAVDDTDDGYTGDNRDGDEQWYQYRTQEFCANAAYSLYGKKRYRPGVFGCTRGHFINSFFTYGGADNLLKAAGKTPLVYYDNGGYYQDDDSYSTPTNAQCVEIDQGDDNYNNRQRDLSNSNDQNGPVSSLGCNAKGEYMIASFDSNTCDGNYFMGELDSFKKYNRQQRSLGCQHIWSHGNKNSYESLFFLLNNSWSCDLDLYPNGCPDPYGKKAQYNYALSTVSKGGNAAWALRNIRTKRPMRIFSWIATIVALLTVSLAYYMRNRDRIKEKGGRFRGFFLTVIEDCTHKMKRLLAAARKRRAGRRSRKSKSPSKKSKKSKKKKDKKKSKKDKDVDVEAFDDEEGGVF